MNVVLKKIKGSIRDFFSNFSKFFLKKKTLLSIGALSLIAMSYCCSSIFCEFLPINITSSIADVARNKKNGQNTIHVYPNNTITISSETEMEDVNFVFENPPSTIEMTVNNGTFNTVGWSGNSKSVVFTIGKDSPVLLISNIIVKYSDSNIETEAIVMSKLDFKNKQVISEINCSNCRINFGGDFSCAAPSFYDNETIDFVIYPHKLVDIDVMTYRTNEDTTKMRDLYPDQQFLDVYLSNWNGLYSPGYIETSDSKRKDISFLVMPKSTYIRTSWIYNDIDFVYPKTGAIKSHNVPNEIFITKEYADYLISQDPYAVEGDYSYIVDEKKVFNIPYKWSWKSSDTIHKPTIVNTYYTISGIINEESESYLRYKNMVGDFFIVNELTALPIPSITIFEISKNSRFLKNVLNVALDTYKYESTTSTAYSNSGNMLFEYRASTFNNIAEEDSLKNIDVSPSIVQKKCDDVFNVFSYKQNFVYLIIFGILSLAAIALSIFLLTKLTKANIDVPLSRKIIFFTILWTCSYLIGFAIEKIFSLAFKPIQILTMNYYFIGVIVVVLTISYFLAICLKQKKKKESL